MQFHGHSGALGFPELHVIQNHVVVAEGVPMDHLLDVGFGKQAHDLAVDDGHQPHHELVVGGQGDAVVKQPVDLHAVLAVEQLFPQNLAVFQNLGQLLVRGALGRVIGRLGLENQPDLVQILQPHARGGQGGENVRGEGLG